MFLDRQSELNLIEINTKVDLDQEKINKPLFKEPR